MPADSPALKVKSNPAWTHYSLGPPYVVHKSDMVKIAKYWHDFVPRQVADHNSLIS